MKFASAFASQPKWLIVAEMLALLMLVGAADWSITWTISLFVFYGAPIFVLAWCVGRGAAFGAAFLAGLVWVLVNFHENPYLTGGAYAWAAANRFIYFGFVAVGGSAMRHQREVSRQRIEALTLAREYEMEVVRAGEREQIRIGQDLHDGVCQNLAAIDCATACLREELEAGGLPQAALAAKIQQFLQETIVEARSLARGIVPVQVERDGMVSALSDLVAKTNLARKGAAAFRSSGDVRIEDPQIALHLYRIAQEALSNAVRHGRAGQIDVSLGQNGSGVVLTIADDGGGFQADAKALAGLGLSTMRYRAKLIGADLKVVSEPGSGTIVECRLPVFTADDAPPASPQPARAATPAPAIS